MNAPVDIKEKLAKNSNNLGVISGSVELVILYNVALIQKNIYDIGGSLEELNYGFDIVNIPFANVEKLAIIIGIEYI